MEVSIFDGKMLIWEVVENHVSEKLKDNDEIGLWGVDFNLFEKDDEGVVRKLFIEYPYLLMLMKLWPG